MQQQWVFLMLLAVTCLWTAHGRTFQLNKDFMTSQLAEKDAAVGQMDESNLDLDNVVTIRTPSSAVQDWSLVCQQLCGAALGGAVCAPYCENLPFLPFEIQLKNAEQILDSKQDLICPELCGLQLGDDVCTCKNYTTKDIDVDVDDDEQQQTNVCAVLCEHKHVTLTGCTPCKSLGEGENNMEINLNKFQDFSQKEAVPLEDFVASTPDWTQLCAVLCKIGEGGSLCNCNFLPFQVNL